jgi:hypothetical protein
MSNELTPHILTESEKADYAFLVYDRERDRARSEYNEAVLRASATLDAALDKIYRKPRREDFVPGDGARA